MLLNENKRSRTLQKSSQETSVRGTCIIQKIVSLFYQTRINIIAEGERKIAAAAATAIAITNSAQTSKSVFLFFPLLFRKMSIGSLSLLLSIQLFSPVSGRNRFIEDTNIIYT